jgi:biotin protein ligase-like protein
MMPTEKPESISTLAFNSKKRDPLYPYPGTLYLPVLATRVIPLSAYASCLLLLYQSREQDNSLLAPCMPFLFSETTLKTATLYAQPGGDGTVETAAAALDDDVEAIQNFVKAGGRYLGFCMGGYLAGKDPGFDLLPGNTDQLIALPGASVTTEDDTIITVDWRDKPRSMYFQDGPYFLVNENTPDVTMLATYTNNQIAAMVTPYGQGKVGVVGPHPEATDDWYQDYQLHDPDGLDADLGQDLIDTTMQ